MNLTLLWQLFCSFFKIGLLAFGGGMAVIPLLQKEIVEERTWLTTEELAEIMAISQTMPGIIMVNSATIVGCRIAGFWGGLIATITAIAPTFIITILVTVFFWGYTDNPLIKKALTGILLGVTALIVYAITTTWKSVVRDYFDIFLVILASTLLILLKINVVWVIIGTAILGFTYHRYFKKTGNRSN